MFACGAKNVVKLISFKIDYTRRARVAPLGTFVRPSFKNSKNVNLAWIMIFSIGKKLNIFVFTLCIWTHLWKILIFGSYTLRKTFFIFSSKKLDVVAITGYQITFWIFDFSLLEILPKYMNPKIVLRTLYALDDLPKIADGRTDADVRTSIFKRLPHKSP